MPFSDCISRLICIYRALHINGNVMTKSVVTRMSLRSDKDVGTYLLKSRSDDNETMSCYRGFNFYKENYIHDIPFF
jgi:hypothetical protein